MKSRNDSTFSRPNVSRPLHGFVRLGAAGSLVCLAGVATFLSTQQPAVAEKQPASDPGVIAPQCVIDRLANQAAVRDARVLFHGVANQGGTDGGGCPQETVTYSSHNFQSGSFIAEQGMVNTEIAAVTYTLPAVNFPIRIDRVDALVGTSSLSNQITMHWSVLVWEGQPNSGTLVYTIQSDGDNPPHVVASPPTNAVLVQASVDPGDPEQIIVTNNGSNKFSVGFRIDQHNQSATTTCPCVPQFPGLGTYPAICCPPPEHQNMFPTVDTDTLSQPSNNWIFARSCPGATGLCDAAGGWYTNSSAGIQHDWNIRVAYTPTGCITPSGACCVPNGSCLDGLTAAQCQAQGGAYQGNNSQCGSIICPAPTGGCCLNDGTCQPSVTQTQCLSQGGTFLGVGSLCNPNSCKGACCVPSTFQCVLTTPANCSAVNGIFQGLGTNCASVACFGACCLPNGSCSPNLMPSECTAQGGIFQGANTSCSQANCPPPVGACCVGTNCLSNVTQTECTVGFGGVWKGALSTCSPNNPCVAPACPADIAPAPNGDHAVNVSDLLMVINSWGACPAPPNSCRADIAPQPSGDGNVNVSDLLYVINHWGACP